MLKSRFFECSKKEQKWPKKEGKKRRKKKEQKETKKEQKETKKERFKKEQKKMSVTHYGHLFFICYLWISHITKTTQKVLSTCTKIIKKQIHYTNNNGQNHCQIIFQWISLWQIQTAHSKKAMIIPIIATKPSITTAKN